VAEVVANSPASRAGIEANDIIISVNGEQVFNVGDYEKIISANYGIEVKHRSKTPRCQYDGSEGNTGGQMPRRVKVQPGSPCLR